MILSKHLNMNYATTQKQFLINQGFSLKLKSHHLLNLFGRILKLTIAQSPVEWSMSLMVEPCYTEYRIPWERGTSRLINRRVWTVISHHNCGGGPKMMLDCLQQWQIYLQRQRICSKSFYATALLTVKMPDAAALSMGWNVLLPVGTGHCHGSACSNAGSFIVDEDEDEDGQWSW